MTDIYEPIDKHALSFLLIPTDKVIEEKYNTDRIEYSKLEAQPIDSRIAAIGNAWDF
jgi:hypothetical protein